MRQVNPLFRVFGYLLFFGWNLWFLSWILLGFGPIVLFGMTVAVVTGMVPASFGLYAWSLVAIPVAGLALGLTPRLRGDPGRLLSMFYGVQFPLMVLCGVRLFALEQLTAPFALALLVAGLGAASLLRTLWAGPEERSAVAQGARLVGQSGYLLVGLWCAALGVLYGVTLGSSLVVNLFDAVVFQIRYPSVYGWRELPMMLLFGGMFLATAAVLMVFPVAMIGITLRSFQLVAGRSVTRFGAPLTAAVSALTVLGWVAAIGLTGRQPQGAAFARLDAATDDARRREALAHSDQIRDGLLFARLSVERTLDADPTGEHVVELWKPLIGETLAEAPRAAWTSLLWPFVYHPVVEGQGWAEGRERSPVDAFDADTRYAAFFDAPIEVAERDVLVAAASQTWSWEEARAGLLDVGQQKVWLERQDLRAEPHGDLAAFTLHEVYRNHTWDQQEVSVHFSLPETAALTGLWLGVDDDRSHAFQYVVAPRGAAQQVYEEQVRVRRDPALLEQVGPRQYRLRAFPVLPREGQATDPLTITGEGPALHLWMEWTVAVEQDGDGRRYFPLPRAAEVRNLYWDDDSARTVDGVPFESESWMPMGVDATAAPAVHEAVIDGWHVRAEPYAAVQQKRFGRVTVLVDGTRSMEGNRAAVNAAITRLRGAAEQVDVLCTVEQALGACPAFDAEQALFWGSVALETRLVAAAPLAAGSDALVVLTDGGSYSLAAGAEAAGLPDLALPPLWLVHFGSDPTAYPDWTLDRLSRSGGGVASSVEEVVVRSS
ncbi:MAG: TIGR02921 family PEP-CTERM protein, partial [Myxococcota bacterium]